MGCGPLPISDEYAKHTWQYLTVDLECRMSPTGRKSRSVFNFPEAARDAEVITWKIFQENGSRDGFFANRRS